MKLKRELNNLRIMVGESNDSLMIINRKAKHKVHKGIQT